MGDFASFHMTFHVPKGLQIVATGKQISRDSDGGKGDRVVWATDAPIPVAGFNLGDFKSKEEKTPAGFVVDAYANTGIPDQFSALTQTDSLGTMSTVGALPNEVSQGNAAIQIYSDFFGKLPYDHVALTQQSACNYGQSWPMLVYLPICAFWDNGIQHQLGLLDYDRTYWTEVTPHEVSHQWWGNLVGFNSYRDQWMSEGFANFSVGIFLINTQPKADQYRAFWNEQHDNLLKKNVQGMRPVDVGPLTMGARVSNEKSGGNVYEMLIYSKGAYILHMLDQMYWTPQGGETAFKQSMHQFVTQYTGKAATTEDLKTSFEHSMPRSLDLRGDGKLDWFFDEYVYGTELPHYVITSEFSVADGETSVHLKLAQSNVSKNFAMIVPVYLQMENGMTVRIANVPMFGAGAIDHTMKLGKLPSPAKKLLLNYNSDVLSD
jgi:aminopeptidase N